MTVLFCVFLSVLIFDVLRHFENLFPFLLRVKSNIKWIVISINLTPIEPKNRGCGNAH